MGSRRIETAGRLILSGDTRQHGPVEASDAMLALERYANLKPAELRKIRRQNPKLGQANEEKRDIRRYRRAVADAAAGKLAESFAGLEKLGAVVAWVLAAPARFRLQKNEKGFITQIAVRYLGEEASDAKAEAKAQSQ